MRKDTNFLWKFLIIAAGLVTVYFIYVSTVRAVKTEGEAVVKVSWCHCEPNGNCQTLLLPQKALEKAGHVNASGNPLHAGDYAGACNEVVSPTPEVTVEPTPELTPVITVTLVPTVQATPTAVITPIVTPSVSVTPVVTAKTEEKKTETVVPATAPNTGKAL